jgi:pilus assembly protein CpaC
MNRKFCVVFFVCCFLLAAYCFVLTDEVKAQGPPRITLEATPQRIYLMVGESKILKLNEKQGPATKVELVDPNIADAIILTPWQIYISGKSPGITPLVLRGKDGVAFYTVDLEVSPNVSRLKDNVSRLKEVLHNVLPEEKDVKVTVSHDGIILSGTVSTTSNLSQVLTVAESYFPGEKKVTNLLDVAGVQQVMVEVRVSEMSRSLLRGLGFNFNYIGTGGNAFGLSLLSKLTSLTAGPKSPVSVSDKINAIFGFVSKGATWTTFIDALKEEGLLKVLAEPTLIALSGKTANFLAGGEIPIPVPQAGATGAATVTIEYKPFGVGLNFTPVVLSNKKINMLVAPEVSELDFSNAITISGFVIPALTTRRASTTIELDDGQSFAIAGLLKDEIRTTVDRFPILGDIPIIGALFRSTSYQKNDTELIIIVTPHLVKPLDMAKQTLPTDQYIDPDDFEFYMLGNVEGKEKMRSGPASSSTNPRKGPGLEGDFGHIVPK